MQFRSAALLTLSLSSLSLAAATPDTPHQLYKRDFTIPIFNCPLETGLQCIVALGPAVVACVAGGIGEGLNPVTGIPGLVACGVDVFNDIVNMPAPCQTCLNDLIANLGLHFQV